MHTSYLSQAPQAVPVKNLSGVNFGCKIFVFQILACVKKNDKYEV